MKNMNIGKRLILSFLLISVLASIAGVVGLTVTLTTDANYSDALVMNGFSQGDIGSFNTYLNKGSALVRDVIFLTDENDLSSTRSELDAADQSMNASLADLRGNCQTPAELELIAVIDEKLPQYLSKRGQVVELGMANKNEEALKLFIGEARPVLNEVQQAAQSLADLNETMGGEVSVRLTTQSRISVAVIVTVLLAALAVSMTLGVLISRGISRPLTACAARLNLLSDGDLHSPVPRTGTRDEVGRMLDSMDRTVNGLQDVIKDLGEGLAAMSAGDLTVAPKVEYKGDYTAIKDSMSKILGSLNETMREINRSSDQVASGADQVSSGAQALSQGATEQASSVEELAATINEISGQISANAQSARQADEKTRAVGGQAAQSNQRMQEMLEAMNDISRSSQEIGKIIKTIEDIAFQTNILALNAAVEAARAGAAGKGFAVVADEVRNLANKSQEASKNTASLIEGALGAVEHGRVLADETAGVLTGVVTGVNEVAASIGEISAASARQAESIAQVTTGIDQISAVVQTNSATSEESAAASEELSGQAQTMRDLVGRFRLKDGAADPSPVFTHEVEPSAAGDAPASFGGKY